MLPFSASFITREQYLQSSEHLQLLLFIKMWCHWYNTKTSHPFYFRKHYCTHGPTSQLCSSTTYDSSKFCQKSLDFATLPEQISVKFQFLQVLLQKKTYKITHCIQLIFYYNILQIHSKQGRFSHLHGWELSRFPSGTSTPCQSKAAGLLWNLTAVSCTAPEPQTLPLQHNFYLFLFYWCLGLWKELF